MPMNRTWMTAAIVALCGAVGFGVAFMRSSSQPSSEVAEFRATMAANFAAQCFKAARSSSPADVTDAKLHSFCDCTATRVNKALSDADVTVLAEQERKGVTAPPALLMDKAKPIAAICRSEAGLAG
ncbi:hypothetical protein AZA_89196 [Nitrospirillum viridazoti Y2]|uniref:Uncharacterized protein n=1 Tax=Nitrospirillum amazonense TaxID=28077 RepID=A0A560ICD1_9PROT|nr:hypothetical protein [Nitrospirillum amazonense]EGY00824.1 hypothetical protein AZA_89196 [Nitrospirillum amazonense Y2]TWB56706.1 hypothetical protein FBZ92_110127 [Nitrospirillum amazonense]